MSAVVMADVVLGRVVIQVFIQCGQVGAVMTGNMLHFVPGEDVKQKGD